MRMIKIIGVSVMIGVGAMSAGCASISEDDCLAGNWAERGFKDGTRGVSSSRLEDYAKRCAKFSTSVDETAYLREYENGLQRYCVFDKGFDRGKAGSSYNTVCTGELADGYEQGFEEGRIVYQIHKDHENLIEDYNETLDEILTMREKLDLPDVSVEERRRIKKKLLRLQDRREGLRRDIRRHEREFGLSRYDFD